METIKIINTTYGNFAEINGHEIEVFKNGMELANGWAFEEWEWKEDMGEEEIEIVEIDLLDFPNEGAKDEYECDGETYQHYCGSCGEFLVNEDANYIVFVAYIRGCPSDAYKTYEEAEKYLEENEVFYYADQYRYVKKYENFGEYCEDRDGYIDWYIPREIFEKHAKYAIIGIEPICYDVDIENLGSYDSDNKIQINGEKYIPVDGINDNKEIQCVNKKGTSRYAYFVFSLDGSIKDTYCGSEAVFEHISDAVEYIREKESESKNVIIGIIPKSAPDGANDPFNQYNNITFKNMC